MRMNSGSVSAARARRTETPTASCALGVALIDPPRGRHVGVVAARPRRRYGARPPSTLLVGSRPIQRVEGRNTSTQAWVASGIGAVAGLTVGEQIAGHVAGRHAPGSADGNHDVREVLADAACRAPSARSMGLSASVTPGS